MSTEVFGAGSCSHVNISNPPMCQLAHKVASSGEVTYQQSYCKGDFPYCAPFNGDCCSDPTDGTCCFDTKVVSHKVQTINVSSYFSQDAYKCCSIAEYGKKSTYYFDGEGHVHCCGGEVYQEKSDGDKTCCNHKYDENGNVTRYYKTATVDGSPTGEAEKICCEVLGEGSGEYRQTAYWNGGAHCCDGKTHKTGKNDAGNETYACCVGSKGKNKTHKVVEDVLGAPNGEEACCSIESYGKSPTGYWNGSSAQCCKGKARKNGVDSDGQVKYACCEGDTAENPTQKKVSVLDAPNGEEACCDIATYGSNPTAYWNGSSAVCCKGEAKKKTDGTYVCCSVVETCPDGSTPTPNHVDDIEGTCGSICCKVKADVYSDECEGSEGIFEGDCSSECIEQTNSEVCMHFEREQSGYVVVGAVNGSCCGGYTSESNSQTDYWEDGWVDEISWSSTSTAYTIKNNNGGYYCADDGSYEHYLGYKFASSWSYPSPDKFISKFCEDGGSLCYYSTTTCTSTSGDPYKGECTDEDNENQDKGCDEIDFCKDWF
ncbi:MAG: hypothetical protein J6U64_04515 [Alphaproteobacteria bacterium]|nr:hypothetical protein [Alphaproteobacteria bacterium]